MKKMRNVLIIGLSSLFLLFGTVAVASVSKISDIKEALKDKYKTEFEQFTENFYFDELQFYQEEKVEKLESESRLYFEHKKDKYKKDQFEKLDKEYEDAQKKVNKYIDSLFDSQK